MGAAEPAGASGPSGAAYPAAPWHLVGQMWVTLFAGGGAPGRPRGLYAAAFVSYEPGSPLVYSELLAARVLGGTRVEITDIWVDSPASMAGGRELWAIPKGLADLRHEPGTGARPVRDTWAAPGAAATFSGAGRTGVRLPLRGGTRQPPLDGGAGPVVLAPIRGSARVAPCRARWELEPDGPLGWLSGARQLGSVRLSDFRLSFG